MLVKPGRNNFDAIRLAMALLVVWSHSFTLHTGTEKREWVNVLLNGAYTAGTVAVMAFFIISGFLIAQSWERSSSATSYFEKRVRRIYPGFLVATSICAFAIAPVFGGDFPNPSRIIAGNLALRGFMPSAFASNPYPGVVNGSLWSIPFEFLCYIGVAIAGTYLLKRPRALLGLAALLVLGKVVEDATGIKPGLGIIGDTFGWQYIWMNVGQCFLLGMLAYRISLPRSPVILCGLIAAAWGSCWLSLPLADLFFAPALAYAVFYFAFSPRIKLHDAAKFGDFSYGTYLYAFPIQQMLQAAYGSRLNLAEFIVLAMILSLLAAVLSWHLVEKPFMRRGGQKVGVVPVLGRREGASAAH